MDSDSNSDFLLCVCMCVCVFLQRERSGMEWNRDDDIKENDNDANIEDDIEDEY